MAQLARELKTLPGAMISIILLLMVTWFILNLMRNKLPAPLGTGAGFVLDHATGYAYENTPVVMPGQAYVG